MLKEVIDNYWPFILKKDIDNYWPIILKEVIDILQEIHTYVCIEKTKQKQKYAIVTVLCSPISSHIPALQFCLDNVHTTPQCYCRQSENIHSSCK